MAAPRGSAVSSAPRPRGGTTSRMRNSTLSWRPRADRTVSGLVAMRIGPLRPSPTGSIGASGLSPRRHAAPPVATPAGPEGARPRDRRLPLVPRPLGVAAPYLPGRFLVAVVSLSAVLAVVRRQVLAGLLPKSAGESRRAPCRCSSRSSCWPTRHAGPLARTGRRLPVPGCWVGVIQNILRDNRRRGDPGALVRPPGGGAKQRKSARRRSPLRTRVATRVVDPHLRGGPPVPSEHTFVEPLAALRAEGITHLLVGGADAA